MSPLVVFEVGKLYSNEWYYLELYKYKTDINKTYSIGRIEKQSDKQIVINLCARASKYVGHPVSFIEPNGVFMVISAIEKGWKQAIQVLCGDKIGWIFYPAVRTYEFKEVKE